MHAIISSIRKKSKILKVIRQMPRLSLMRSHNVNQQNAGWPCFSLVIYFDINWPFIQKHIMSFILARDQLHWLCWVKSTAMVAFSVDHSGKVSSFPIIAKSNSRMSKKKNKPEQLAFFQRRTIVIDLPFIFFKLRSPTKIFTQMHVFW